MKKMISMLLALVMVLSMFCGISLAADKVEEPKVIANAAAATTEAAVIENPANVKIWEPRKLTEAEWITLIQDIALAYYYQSNEESHIQYDGRSMSYDNELQRQSDEGRPEDAWFDSTVYSVCSNYCWKVYRRAVGTDYGLFRMTYARTRTWSDFDPAKTPELVYQFTGPDCKNSKGETDIEKARVESRKLVRPGDVLVHSNLLSGHALLFVGPIFKDFGDNTDYILHCKGSSFDNVTGQDHREAPGECINLMKADETFWGGDVSWSFSKKGSSDNGMAILRPTLDPAFPELPTQEAMARMQFPRMKIARYMDRYQFDSATAGEEVPVFVTVTNNGSKELTEVPVEEYIPEGTTYVEGSATKTAKVEGNTIKWAVKIPAGKTITLTYKVKVNETAKLGDTISFKGGMVGGIESRSFILQVGGKKLTEEQNAKLFAHGEKLNGTKGAYRDLDFVNKFYADCLGINAGLPKTVDGLLRKLTNKQGEFVFRTGKLGLDKMIIPLHMAGQYMEYTGGDFARVREFKSEYYMPGDVFILVGGDSKESVVRNTDVTIVIYLGNEKVLTYNTKGCQLSGFDGVMGWSYMNNLIIGLRPSLAQADLGANTVKKMAFTDVKDNDWFYSNVKKMVETGVINGMTETTFVPNGNLTWGQALKLVCVGMGEGEQPAGSHWASGYMTLAKEKGWLSKDVDLNANITRKEFCQVAAKADNLTAQPSKNPFSDCNDKDVLALVEAGVINGMTATTFAPDALLTRAQIAKIMSVLVNV